MECAQCGIRIYFVRNLHFRRKSKLNNYSDAATCSRNLAPLLRSRLEHLNQGGFRVLHDVVFLLQPLADLTISNEWDLYNTSSTVIPKLIQAKRNIDGTFEAAESAINLNGNILDPVVVQRWFPTWKKLWSIYLSGFLEDESFLCATLLDPRHGCGRSLTIQVLSRAKNALLEKLKDVYKKRESSETSNNRQPTAIEN